MGSRRSDDHESNNSAIIDTLSYTIHTKLGLTTFIQAGSNCVQTSWMGYELLERARASRTLNLLKIVCEPSHSEAVLKNIVRTSLVWQGLNVDGYKG